MHDLAGPPLLHLTWETDPDCCKLIAARFPQAKPRGDVLKETASSVVEIIDKHDPHQTCAVIMAAAPPCPDFSQMNASAEGFDGAEGSKFTSYVQLADSIEAGLGPRQVRHLCENVVFQHKAECNYISSALRAEPVVLDAADFGSIGRPRLWWTRVNWRDYEINPLTDHQMKWHKHQGYHRIFMEPPADDLGSFDTQGLTFDEKVRQGVVKMPCLTTPAPTEQGRPAPKRSKGRIDDSTRNRWVAGNRQFAPWHYAKEAMLSSADGDLHLPPVEVKEQLHHMPPGFTPPPGD